MKKEKFLIFILIIAVFFRLYKLSSIPAGFFCDEASIGYNAYSILNSGKDEYGVPFPIFFQSLGDYKSPLAIYLTIPFIKFFGLNEFSTRLTSVLAGLTMVAVMYFVGKELSMGDSKLSGLLVAFVTATMPWLIHYSRVGFEYTLYCVFFVSSVYLFLKAQHYKKYIIPAFVLAAITMYTYQSAKLLIPVLIIGVIVIYRKSYLLYKRNTLAGLILLFVLSLPLVLSFFSGQGFARFKMVSVFSAKLPFSETALRILHNYFIQLSPGYFILGEPTFITRHFTGGLIPLLITTFPFLLFGLMRLLFSLKNNKNNQFIMFWFLIYPIAGAITRDGPFTGRSVIGAPLFAILISLGVVATISYTRRFSKRLIIFLILGIFLINLICFGKFYFIRYPLYSSDFWGWQYGPKEILQYFLKYQAGYDNLFMSGEYNAPEIFIKFFTLNKCSKCEIGGFERLDLTKKQLFAFSLNSFNELRDKEKAYQFFPRKIIYYPNGDQAFIITEAVKINENQ